MTILTWALPGILVALLVSQLVALYAAVHLHRSVKAFVLAKNLARRHLDASQRAMVAGRLATMPQGRPPLKHEDLPRGDDFELTKKERGELDGVFHPEKQVNLPLSQAAEILKVSVSAVQHAKTVLASGAPDLIHAVEAGTIPVSVAKDVARLTEAVWIP